MRRRNSLLLAAGILILAAACGNDHDSDLVDPSDLPPEGSTTLSIRSAESQTPVAGASVTLSSIVPPFSQTYTSDQSGNVTLGADVPSSFPLSMDISASGYLSRVTSMRSASDTQFPLWPSSSPTGLDEGFTAILGYSPSACPAVNAPSQPLRRPASTVHEISIAFDSTLADAQAETAHSTAITRLNTALAGAVTYAFVHGSTSGVVFTAAIDPAAATCTAGPEPFRAATFLTLSSNNEIVGGRLVYCTVEAARSVGLVLHELRHTYGLYHSASQSDVMYCSSGRPSAFTARETLLMNLMHQRRPGNRWPDNDRQTIAPLSVRPLPVMQLVCGG